MTKETSDKLSALASDVLKRGYFDDKQGTQHVAYNRLLADAKSLAGSVLSQDETPGTRQTKPATRDVTLLILDALMANRGFEREEQLDPETADLLRRDAEAVAGALPSNAGTDFVRLMEVWSEDSTNLTATLLDMAISATMLHYRPSLAKGGETITITSAELRTIAEQYHWERFEEPGSWTLRLTKILEMGSD